LPDAISSLRDIVTTFRLEGFDDVYWNVGQVLAWAQTRSPFSVDTLSDSTPELARRDYSMPSGLPHFAADLADTFAEDNGLQRIERPFNSDSEVRRAVLRSFQAGTLTASGQRQLWLVREPIPPLEWADLVMDDNASGPVIIRHREGHAAAWHDVRVHREDVLKCFPAETIMSTSDSLHDQVSQNPSADEVRLPSRPPEGAFDPDTLSHWSITMALAWIIWGDIRAVREEWDDYRSQCAEWRFFPDLKVDASELEGAIRNATLNEPAPSDPEIFDPGRSSGSWKLSGWGPSGWLGIEFKARRDEVPWERMIEVLWLAAGEGRIKATALKCATRSSDGKMVEIPTHLWPRLRRRREPSGKAILAGPDCDFRDVKFSRLDVKSLWPPRDAAPAAQDGERCSAPAETTPHNPPKRGGDQARVRGRKPGQGSYLSLDIPLLREMKRLLAEGKAASAEEAARQVAPRAHGYGTIDSKAERLARRFRQAPSE